MKKLSTTQTVMLSFFLAILAGSILLVLPVSAADGITVSYIDAFNLNTLSGGVKFVKRVLIGTFVVEGIGALLYMTVFVPEYGARGIWISVFNSISAFCNAGIDIIAEDSLCAYAVNPMINLTTCLLIILGGIGYVVWWDLLRVLKKSNSRNGNASAV